MMLNIPPEPAHSRAWPEQVPEAPAALVELVADAMRDFGLLGYSHGAAEVAALALHSLRRPPRLVLT